MIFGNDRNQLRRFYLDAWRKQQAREELTPLEKIVADIVTLHPEYHALLQDEDKALASDFGVEGGQTNPFLHMGMHIAIHEQLGMGRPEGIREAYQTLVAKLGDHHSAEHQMMECLGQVMWEAQRNGTPPDELVYLACVRKL